MFKWKRLTYFCFFIKGRSACSERNCCNIFFLLILWGVILSHRFAGPIERLERELKAIAENKAHKHRITLRKHDDIRPVAEAINKVLDKMEERK